MQYSRTLEWRSLVLQRVLGAAKTSDRDFQRQLGKISKASGYLAPKKFTKQQLDELLQYLKTSISETDLAEMKKGVDEMIKQRKANFGFALNALLALLVTYNILTELTSWLYWLVIVSLVAILLLNWIICLWFGLLPTLIEKLMSVLHEQQIKLDSRKLTGGN